MKQLNYSIYQDSKTKVWNMVMYQSAGKTSTKLWAYLHPILWDILSSTEVINQSVTRAI